MHEVDGTRSTATSGPAEEEAGRRPAGSAPAAGVAGLLRVAAVPGVGLGAAGRGALAAAAQAAVGNRTLARTLAGRTRLLMRSCEEGETGPGESHRKEVSDHVFGVALRSATSGWDGVTFTLTNQDCRVLTGYRMHGEPTGRARWTADQLHDDLKVALKWAFESPGRHRIVLGVNTKNEIAMLEYELEQGLRNNPTPGVPFAAPGSNTVVVIGSPSPGQKYSLQFVTAAVMEKGHTVWMVERTGYEAAGVSLDRITDKAPGGRVKWITPEKDLVAHVNSLPRGSVKRLVVYSHGVEGQVALRYGWGDKGKPDYGLDRSQARRIDGDVFSKDALVDLESCQGGTNLEGGSLAQVVADRTGRNVVGWTGRTSYADVNAGRGGVRGSEYGANWDAFREFWVRNWVAEDTPRRKTFKPALARAVADRRLMRRVAEGYGYGFADDPLNAGGFGRNDAAIRVRPGPVRTTSIRDRPVGEAVPVAEKAPEASARPAAAAAPEEPLTPVREMILAEIAKWTGAREGAPDDPRFGQVFTASVLENARIEAASDVHLSGPRKGEAKKPSKHTTCIDFQTVVYARVREQMAKSGKTMKRIVTPMNAPSLGAWVQAEPGMPATKRPKRGDFYVLWSTKEGKGGKVEPRQFSHVAWFTGLKVNDDGSETWTSVDGGQGVAADYSPSGVLVSKGAEAILACTRTYFPGSNLVAGGVANQAAGGRWLLGWIDMDKLVS